MSSLSMERNDGAILDKFRGSVIQFIIGIETVRETNGVTYSSKDQQLAISQNNINMNYPNLEYYSSYLWSRLADYHIHMNDEPL